MRKKSIERITKVLVVAVAMAISTTSCSTSGGVYSKGDSRNGEFSAMRSLLLAGAAIAVVAAAKNGGGGGSGYGDNGADWDQFYNEYHQLVWACREIASGRFTYESNCAGKAKTDIRWPGK